MERADEGCQTHCCGEDEVAPLPGGEEVGFVFVDGSEEGSDGFWTAGGEAAASFLVGGMDDEGEENGASEGDDGEDDEGEGTDAANVAEGVFGG